MLNATALELVGQGLHVTTSKVTSNGARLLNVRIQKLLSVLSAIQRTKKVALAWKRWAFFVFGVATRAATEEREPGLVIIIVKL